MAPVDRLQKRSRSGVVLVPANKSILDHYVYSVELLFVLTTAPI